MQSIKEYNSKISRIEIQNKKLENKLIKKEARNKKLTKENKYLRRSKRQITRSRDNWKGKHNCKQKEIKLLKAKANRLGKAKRHHYELWIVDLCILLRIQCNCSYKSICKILMIINICFKLRVNKIPCANTVQNWVSKVGLYCIENTKQNGKNREVSLIIDENIRLGKEKLLLMLSTPFQKDKIGALCFEDVTVEYMKGSQTWTGEKIKEAINEIQEENNIKVMNILSDEDSKLK
jgi:hypothetical protein